MKQPIPALLYSVANVDLSKMPYNAIGFLHIHWLEAPAFLKDKDLTSYLYF